MTQKELKKRLHYDPETGVFTWKDGRFAGKEAGGITPRGKHKYRNISLCGKRYYAHRLAWLYMTGEWPEDRIDHADYNGLNNKFSNLRCANHAQNMANSGARNRLGVKGVSRIGKRYMANITSKYKTKYLGMFDTIEEASTAYQAAARTLYGDFVMTA